MDNTFICSYSRTPIGSFQGNLKNIHTTKLGANTISATLKKINFDASNIDEVIMGNVLSAGLGQAPARQAAIYAGLPYSVECMTINKVCGSGLKAVMLADQSIKTGNSNFVIAGGMENMSMAPYYIKNGRNGLKFGDSKLIDSILFDGLMDPYDNVAMGNCAEILVQEEKFSREEQDSFAIESYKRSNLAIKDGMFNNEISPVEIKNRDKVTVVDCDEEPLKFNEDKIKKLKPAFDKKGSITAANASSLNDGAASLLIASKDKINEFKIKPIAKIIDHVSYAMEPKYFTKAPIYAINKLLEKTGIPINDIDLFEINEAFSCVAIAAMKNLGIPHSKLNIFGGAVSLGHPIGASGARILITLLNALEQKQKKFGVACLCIGGGEAAAILVERIN